MNNCFEKSARSPLCHIPEPGADLQSRTLDARDTLSYARQALWAYSNGRFNEDKEFGDYLILQVIHQAIGHAENLLKKDQPDDDKAEREIGIPVTGLESALIDVVAKREGLTGQEFLEKIIKERLKQLPIPLHKPAAKSLLRDLPNHLTEIISEFDLDHDGDGNEIMDYLLSAVKNLTHVNLILATSGKKPITDPAIA